jgi:hypothetical protein
MTSVVYSLWENHTSFQPPLTEVPKRDDQQQLRSTVDKDVYNVLKRLAGVRGATLSQVVSEAIDRYLESEDIKQEIQYHKLDSSSDE